MRKRFDQQLTMGQLPIEETKVDPKSKNTLDEMFACLIALYCDVEYKSKTFNLLESYLTKDKQNTGRPGMDLWIIFVLSQVRLCLNATYSTVHNMSNNHRTLRQLLGVETQIGFKYKEFKYQEIYDNLTLLSEEHVKELNEMVVEFGHKVFGKKKTTALNVKTDSFVVKNNVHFPTDYNLLWDSSRKGLDIVIKYLEKYGEIEGWRKIDNWYWGIKGLMRELGKSSKSGGKNKKTRVENAARAYLKKAGALLKKLRDASLCFPVNDEKDLSLIISLEHFIFLMDKHIDLINRRVLLGEKIPHPEKMFSIFETYTEWINKGKPSIELGKKLSITTDQYNLIIDYQLMDEEQDRDILIDIADRVLLRYKINLWSVDKGFWRKENKELLSLEIPKVIMPKLGKRTKAEEKEEKSASFKKCKNRHSAIESNINELQHRGLNRCPDRGIQNFKRYIGLAVCAYNLKKIGREILKQQRAETIQKAA